MDPAMNEIPLHHIFTYNDVDRKFWADHLEDWVPQRIIDAHVHVNDPAFEIETVTEEIKRSSWVSEVNAKPDVPTAKRCADITFPNRDVTYVAFGHPDLGWEIEGSNEDLRVKGGELGWFTLAMTRPTWVAEQIGWWLDKPGIMGVKPYYTLIGYRTDWHTGYLESSIFDFLPHHQLEELNKRRAWVTLHVPKADRLGHPDNIREVKEIRQRYPDVKLVIAHFGRSYTAPHAEEGLLPLKDEEGLYFDCSAVLNSVVYRIALEHLGPDRILFGTDNPMFYMRGRRQWQGRQYINRTSHDLYFNTDRESPEIEATYTLYMYEALKAFKDACQEVGVGREDVERMFYGNARRLMDDIQAYKNKHTVAAV